MNALSQLLMDEQISGRTRAVFKVPENVPRTSQTESAVHPGDGSVLSIERYRTETVDSGPSLRRAG